MNDTIFGELFRVDPATGAGETIDVAGLIPGTLDGLLMDGNSFWVVENCANVLVRVTLSPGLSSGNITSVITSLPGRGRRQEHATTRPRQASEVSEITKVSPR